MKATKKLVEGLQKKRLLPESVPEITNFAEFEALVVEQISTNYDKLDCIVMFDCECIESENSYLFLMEEFISSIASKHGISEIKSKFDINQGRAFCQAEKDSLLHEVSFEQQNDWVSGEFIDFIISLTSSNKGRFIPVSTGDQIFAAIYLNKTLSNAYEKYKSSDKSSRESFLTGHSEMARHMFSDIKILSSLRYREVLSAFKAQFVENDNILEPGSYKKNSVSAALGIEEETNALSIYRMVSNSPITTHNYAPIGCYDFSIICPEGDCFFLSLKEPDKEVIFNYPSKKVGSLIGEQEHDLGDYLIVGEKLDWGIVVSGNMFICVGAPVLSLLNPIKKSITHNVIAPLFDEFLDNHYLPLIDELGYKKTSETFYAVLAKEHEHHWSRIALGGKQDSELDDLTITLYLGVFNPEVESFFKENKNPSTGLDFTKYGSCIWQIPSPNEYKEKIQEICSYIKNIDAEVRDKIQLEKWMALYTDSDCPFNAAIAATLNNDKAEAIRLVNIQIEKERSSRFGLSQDSQSLKLSGIIEDMV